MKKNYSYEEQKDYRSQEQKDYIIQVKVTLDITKK